MTSTDQDSPDASVENADSRAILSHTIILQGNVQATNARQDIGPVADRVHYSLDAAGRVLKSRSS